MPDKLIQKFSFLHDSILINSELIFSNDGTIDVVESMLKDCAQKIGAQRVGMWRLTDNSNYIFCDLMYDRETNSFSNGNLFASEDYKAYFNSFHGERIINAKDARNDFRTRDLASSYLIPNNIFSVYVSPVFVSGQMYGVFKVEYCHKIVDLDISEISYIVSSSDLISLILQKEIWINERKIIEDKQRLEPLTGLENRFFFEERVAKCHIDAEKLSKSCALIVVDVRNFKSLNERFGIHQANFILYEIARRMQSHSMIGKYHLSRIEGDAFGILIPSYTKKSVVIDIAKELVELGKKPFLMPNSTEVVVRFSIAASTSEEAESSQIDLLRCAEMAMQKAKLMSDRVMFYNRLWAEELGEKKELGSALIDAIKSNQLIPFYQPIINKKTNVVGMEALVRWNHPKRGIIAPFKFLTLAKEKGLMKEIGELMIDRACRDISLLKKRGNKICWVSVNLSSEHLYSEDLVPYVLSTLKKYDVSPDALELEILEELIAYDSEIVQDQIRSLKKIGVRLAIDDFGTGYSSLSRLKMLEVSKLKIDKSFIDGITSNNRDQCIAKAIIGLAKGMEITLVAEGVESIEQEKWLIDNDCNFIQGYLYAKPMDLNTLEVFLANRA